MKTSQNQFLHSIFTKVTFIFSVTIISLFSTVNAFPIFISNVGVSGLGPGQFRGPAGVDINTRNNQILVSDVSFSLAVARVEIFNNTGDFVSQFGSFGTAPGSFRFPTGVTYNPSNDQILVADSNNNRVQIFDSNGNFLYTFGSFGAGNGQFDVPNFTAINTQTNQILVSDQNNNRIQIFDSAGNYQSQFGAVGSTDPNQLSNPAAIGILNNQLLVVDSSNNRIVTFDMNGNYLSQFGSLGSNPGQFNNPNGLAINPVTNQILVADTNNNRIQVFDGNGNFQYQFGTLGTGNGQFNNPLTLSLNRNFGQIVITDFLNARFCIYFDPTIWNGIGSPVLQQLTLNQSLVLNNGLTVLGTTTLASGGALTLNPGSTFTTGALTFDGGSFTDNANSTLSAPINLTSNNGTFTSGTNNTLTISSNITGAGGLTKFGAGNQILSGNNTYTGGTTISGGRLSVNGTLNGPVTVNPSSTLGGTGTINGVVTNAGIVSPGNSIGTLTINGSYTQTGNLNIEINTIGQASLLQVQGIPGTVTLGNSSTLTILSTPGIYQPGTLYTLLTATGGTTGTFSTVSFANTNFTSFISPRLIYNANSIQLLLTRNQIAIPNIPPSLPVIPANVNTIINAFNTMPVSTPNNDFAILFSALLQLNASPTSLATAADNISGNEMDASTIVAEDNLAFTNALNGSRLATLRNYREENATGGGCAPYDSYNLKMQLNNAQSNCNGGFWARGFGNTYDQAGSHNGRGFDAKTGGLTLGFDQRLSEHAFVGISIGKSDSKIHWDHTGSRSNLHSTLATLYSTWYSSEGLYLDGSLAGGLTGYSVNRHIAFANIDRRAKHHHRGYEIAPHIGTGYALQLANAVLEPFIGFDYIYVREKGYKEEGANALNLAVGRRTAAVIRSEAGVAISKTVAYESVSVTTRVRLSYLNKAYSKKDTIPITLDNLVPFSRTPGYVNTKNQISPGLGVFCQLMNGGFLSLVYNAELGSGAQTQDAQVKLGLTF